MVEPSFVDYLAEVACVGNVLGLRHGVRLAEVDAVLQGEEFVEDVDKKRLTMRRDYGLIEMGFTNHPYDGWTCFYVTLSLHRLQWNVTVPQPIRSGVGPIPDGVSFHDLSGAIERRGGTMREMDIRLSGDIYYETPAEAQIIVDTTDYIGMGQDAVWSVGLSRWGPSGK
ncbi:hypothetical protein [Nocardia sp. NPDC058705]|uniref:hypothetical protein n=1 Tax=Nocardia sp. NPDC058705 TaxID=3346609 RepID=UPI00368396E5